MTCTIDEFMQYIDEEDIKFIRLMFCDVYGTPKNISVMPSDIRRAFESGIGFNPTVQCFMHQSRILLPGVQALLQIQSNRFHALLPDI